MTGRIFWCAACGFLGACGVLLVVADVFLLCHADTVLEYAMEIIGLINGVGATLIAGTMWDTRNG